MGWQAYYLLKIRLKIHKILIMNIVIFIEGEYRIQPFMINELDAASHSFDRVYIITKEMKSDISTTLLSNEKIRHIQVTQKERRVSGIKNVFRMLCPLVMNQIKDANKDNLLSKEYLKILYRYVSDGYLFCQKTKSIIDAELSAEDNVYVISTWFSIESLSVSLLKKEYKHIHAYSFAHSFEIDKKEDKFMAYYFNDFRHQQLDGVIFISKTMIDIYLKDSGHKFDRYADKFHLEYLGSNKKHEPVNPGSRNEPFIICSCSNVIPIKNLGIILDMLATWDAEHIKWIHFGGGIDLDDVAKRAREITANNSLVEIELKGVTPNDEVQYYYSTSHIDAFINVSISEGLPVSLMEAISYGIPIIATDVGGTREIVDKDYGVLLTSNPTTDELKNAILFVMGKTDDEMVRMRQQALRSWEEQFDAHKNMALFYIWLLH